MRRVSINAQATLLTKSRLKTSLCPLNKNLKARLLRKQIKESTKLRRSSMDLMGHGTTNGSRRDAFMEAIPLRG